jgi:nucleoside-diphosphate-sugar epimerase
VLNSFIERALREKAIRLLDRGEAKRTYCYVSDAMRMVWRILLEGKDPIYNVGGTSSTTILGLAHLIGDLLDVPVRVPMEPSTGVVGAPDDVRLDLAKFVNEFGPIELTGLQEGVARTVEWQKALYT